MGFKHEAERFLDNSGYDVSTIRSDLSAGFAGSRGHSILSVDRVVVIMSLVILAIAYLSVQHTILEDVAWNL